MVRERTASASWLHGHTGLGHTGLGCAVASHAVLGHVVLGHAVLGDAVSLGQQLASSALADSRDICGLCTIYFPP